MSLAYYKRFKMELLLDDLPAMPILPAEYFWVPWHDSLLEHHAEVHYRAFVDEIDTAIFPSFCDPESCLNLMAEIRRKKGFLPAANWLIACADGCVGSVQGVLNRRGYGAIQNVGVVPEHRSMGLGTALVLQALHGFRSQGNRRACLEVTSHNHGAVRLYQRMGFRRMKVLYKSADV